ncbi:MAG: hypothetical protein J0I20_05610 [Chloroflexi bacterium]|nr:hypothetical protein [Chloroflexota bacterium]OJV90084.1 MAG: hypothetical protein BGO39_01550 [Chloroflexi bacterium 54-19]
MAFIGFEFGEWALRRLYKFFEGFKRYRFTLNRGKLSAKTERSNRAGKWWGQDQQWYPGGTPPRLKNRVTPLIDGENYFTELKKALDGAENYVYIAGWVLTPYIPVGRDSSDQLRHERITDLLDTVSKKAAVRILLWNGANFIFKPNRKETAQVKKELEAAITGDFKIILDDSQHITHCHHQKAVVIDGRVAFVGGMDLTSFAGDRFDSNDHPLRSGLNWHDVQLKLEGEIVADVEKNFRQRWEAVAPGPLKPLPHREPPNDPDWHLPAQVIRTIPRRVYKFAEKGEFGIHHSYLNLIAGAKHFIYLENQYLWSPHILKALKKAIQKPRSAPLRIVIVLPAHADDGKYDNDRHVNELRNLDKGRGIVSFYTLYTSGPGMGIHPFTYRGIYVHSKTTIVDDEWFSVGSANLNNRGLVTDSEINVLVHDPELTKSLRVNLWAEHLKMTPAAVRACTVEELVGKVWKEQADRNEAILKEKKEPFYSSLFPYQVGRMPDSWLLEEFETLTFEH